MLDYYNCLRLLEECVKADILAPDPKDKDNILVWVRQDEGFARSVYREGWQSRNAHNIAKELCEDEDGQRVLLTELAKKSIRFYSIDLDTNEKTQVMTDEFYEALRPKKVFVSGSMSISRLPDEVIKYLGECRERGDIILVGDCPSGVDALVQKHLAYYEYPNVCVYSSGEPRLFVDWRDDRKTLGWELHKIDVPKGLTGRAYFTVKDEAMTNDCDKALTVWDGKSKGSRANIDRLKAQGKECVVCKFSLEISVEK